MRSVKNSAMSFCSPVLRGCLSIVYTLQNPRGLYAFLSLSYKVRTSQHKSILGLFHLKRGTNYAVLRPVFFLNCLNFFNIYFFLNHYAPVSQANWCNMTFTAGNLFPSHSCIGWLESSPHQDSNQSPLHERRTTYQLSYPPLFLCNLHSLDLQVEIIIGTNLGDHVFDLIF